MNQSNDQGPHAVQLPGPGVHIPVLDGVRGLAILPVMLLHFELYGQSDQTGAFLDRLIFRTAEAGWVGVDLFFVLSGFLITGILLDSRERPGYLRKFYARRFLRIFPLYYGVLLGIVVFLPAIITIGPGFRSLLDEQLWYWTYTVNIKIGLLGWPRFFAIAHFWSLAVEEQFYLAWPLVILLCPRQNFKWVCVGCILGAACFRAGMMISGLPSTMYVMTLARMDALAVGALLAALVREPAGLRQLHRWTQPALWITGLALLSFFLWQRRFDIEHPWISSVGLSVIAIFFGALMISAVFGADQRPLGRVFSHPSLRFLGRYSYALYVFHHPVAIFLPDHLFGIRDVPTLMGSQLPGYMAFSFVAGAVSLGLSLASWYILESRFLALKRYFGYR